ncbi:MAG: peptidoglycan DD-metalloendopeptidase family protein [Thermodesulfobacteriota bacterium]
MRIPSFIVLVVTLLVIAAGCMVHTGVTHTVKRGENLWRICYTYGVDMQEVAELNNIRDPARIRAGRRLFIPRAGKVRKVRPVSPASVGKYPTKVVYDRGRFSWPITGEISSNFGVRGGSRHDGIDIRAPEGTPIRAAADGVVVYDDKYMRGYGRIIILKHPEDFFTVYAHNKTNMVGRGDRVKRGTVIATVGRSGNATGSHLHFEVRRGKTVRNPLFFLP